MGGRPGGARTAGRATGRRRWPRRRLAVLLGALLALAIVAPVAAAEFVNGNNPTIAADPNNDVYVAGGTVTIDSKVTGDVFVAAGTLDLTNRTNISGSLTAAAGETKVRGRIGGSVRIAAGTVQIFGAVGRDVVVAGGTVEIEPGATVGRDVVVTGGTVRIRGTVTGDVRGSAGDMTIDNRVFGKVDVTVSQLHLGPNAVIDKTVAYTSRNAVDLAGTAKVAGGQPVQTVPDRFGVGDSAFSWLGSTLFRTLCLLVAGLVLVLVTPRLAVAVADGARNRPLPALGFGLLLIVVGPIVLILLMVTIIGIPIALIGWALYFIALYLSQVFVGLAIGRFILPNRWGDEGRGFNLLAMTLGVIIIGALRLIPLPFVGNLIAFLVALLGVGAVAVGLRVRRAATTAPAFPGFGA